MRKLAHFELKSVLSALDHAEFTQVYDFSNLVACDISLEATKVICKRSFSKFHIGGKLILVLFHWNNTPKW